jgi:hypothetical protein
MNFEQMLHKLTFRISVAAQLVARRPMYEDKALANKLPKSSFGCGELPASMLR